ncbi:MAG: hypothetical protein ACREP2_04570 [Rhodanobacteraceae bacterium]
MAAWPEGPNGARRHDGPGRGFRRSYNGSGAATRGCTANVGGPEGPNGARRHDGPGRGFRRSYAGIARLTMAVVPQRAVAPRM